MSEETQVSEATGESKLSLMPLVAFGIGSMIGAGIFGIPSQMAGKAAPGPLLLGWLITGIGMLALAFVYQSLAKTRPDVTGGVYGYARESLGNYSGYASAWSYWLSAWAGNLSYSVVFVGSLGNFALFSFLKKDDSLSLSGLIFALALIWIFHFLILAGVRTAAFVNTVVTFVKVIPILVFIVCAAVAFKVGFFTADFWGNVVQFKTDEGTVGLGSTISQISSMMLVTVWVFIGIEGASVYSTRARKQSDVGKATVIAFLTVLAMLVFVNVLSYGLMAQPELASQADPSMAGALAAAVGPWGSAFINLAMLVSVGGAMLTWIMLAAEILFVPAADGNLMASFGNMNKNDSPTVALWVTNTVSSVFLVIMIYCFSSTYTDLITIAASLILPCYVLSALFQIKQTITEDKQAPGKVGSKAMRMLIGVIAFIYTLWLLWAGGIGLLFLNGLMWLIGTPLYVMGRKQKGLPVLHTNDKVVLAFAALMAVCLFLWLAWFDWSVIDALFWNGL